MADEPKVVRYILPDGSEASPTPAPKVVRYILPGEQSSVIQGGRDAPLRRFESSVPMTTTPTFASSSGRMDGPDYNPEGVDITEASAAQARRNQQMNPATIRAQAQAEAVPYSPTGDMPSLEQRAITEFASPIIDIVGGVPIRFASAVSGKLGGPTTDIADARLADSLPPPQSYTEAVVGGLAGIAGEGASFVVPSIPGAMAEKTLQIATGVNKLGKMNRWGQIVSRMSKTTQKGLGITAGVAGFTAMDAASSAMKGDKSVGQAAAEVAQAGPHFVAAMAHAPFQISSELIDMLNDGDVKTTELTRLFDSMKPLAAVALAHKLGKERQDNGPAKAMQTPEGALVLSITQPEAAAKLAESPARVQGIPPMSRGDRIELGRMIREIRAQDQIKVSPELDQMLRGPERQANEAPAPGALPVTDTPGPATSGSPPPEAAPGPVVKQIRAIADAADESLPHEAQSAITAFVGHEPKGRNAEESLRIPIMNAGAIEDAFGSSPSERGLVIKSQIENTFGPVREKLRSIYGDKIRLYRGQGDIRAGSPARNVLSWTLNKDVAADFVGASEPEVVLNESQIDSHLAKLAESGETRIGNTIFRLDKNGDINEIAAANDYGGEELITSYSNDVELKDTLKSLFKDAEDRNKENEKKLSKVISRDVNLNDVVWVTDRANQKEFIVKNTSPSSGQAAPPISPGESAPPASLKQPWEMTRAEYQAAIPPLKPRRTYALRVGDKTVHVIQNPAPEDIAHQTSAVRAKYPNMPRGEPTLRFTQDANGNRYSWAANEAIHSQIEPKLGKIVKAELNQGAERPIHRYEVGKRQLSHGDVPPEVLKDYPDLSKPDNATPNPERTVIPNGKEEEGQGRQGLLSPSEAQPPQVDGESPAVDPADRNLIGLSLQENQRIRARQGLPPMDPVEERKRIVSMDEAIRTGQKDSALDIAAAAIAGNKPAFSEVTHDGMVLKMVELDQNIKAMKAREREYRAAGKEAAADLERVRINATLEQINTLSIGTRMLRTETARTLGAGGVGIDADTSQFVPAMNAARQANGDKPVPKETAKNIEKWTDEIAKRDAEIAELRKAQAEREAEAERRVAEAVAKTEKRKGKVARRNASTKDAILRERADIMKALAAKNFRVNSLVGVDPEGVHLIGKLAVNYIHEGAMTLDDVVKRVRERLPDLEERDVWQAMNARSPREVAKAAKEMRERIRDMKDQAKLLDDIEFAKVGEYGPENRGPGRDRPPPIPQLKEQLRQLREAIVATRGITPDRLKRTLAAVDAAQKELAGGYRRVRFPGPTPTGELAAAKASLAKIREAIRGEDKLFHLEDKLRKAEQGLFDQSKPRKVSPDRVIAIQKRIADLKRKAAEPSKEAARVARLEEVLRRAEQGVFDPRVKKKPTPERIQQLRDQINKLRAKAEEPMRLQARIARLEEAVRQAEAGNIAPLQTRPPTPNEVKVLRKKLADLRRIAFKSIFDARKLEAAVKRIDDLEQQLKTGARDAKKNPVDVPEELANARAKIAELRRMMDVTDQINDYQTQLDTGNIKMPEKRVAKPLSPLLREKLIQRDRLKNQVDAEIDRIQQKNDYEALSAKGKVWHHTKNLTDELRAIRATGDMSATLRQGLQLATSRPLAAGKAFLNAGEAMFRSKTAEEVMQNIKNSPTYELSQQAKLELTEMDGPTSAREEFFRGKLLERVPGLGNVMRASNRHMTTYLNMLRMSAFDQFVKANPNATIPELTMWADYINKASGRGDLKAFGVVGSAMSKIFFAPKFSVSRFQTPATLVKYWGEPRVRKAIAKDMAATLALGSTALYLASLAGAKVGLDPRDSDFGKMVIGNNHIDIWGGFQQAARLIIGSGAFAVDIKRGIKNMGTERWDPISSVGRFLSYKLNPTITLAGEFLAERDIIGNKKPPSRLWEDVIPLVITDVKDAYNDKSDIVSAIGMGTLSGLGVGVSTFKKKK
jgi:hypothetical protein